MGSMYYEQSTGEDDKSKESDYSDNENDIEINDPILVKLYDWTYRFKLAENERTYFIKNNDIVTNKINFSPTDNASGTNMELHKNKISICDNDDKNGASEKNKSVHNGKDISEFTMNRSNACKKYLEDRYSLVTFITRIIGDHYNPLKIMRYRNMFLFQQQINILNAIHKSKFVRFTDSWYVTNEDIYRYCNYIMNNKYHTITHTLHFGINRNNNMNDVEPQNKNIKLAFDRLLKKVNNIKGVVKNKTRYNRLNYGLQNGAMNAIFRRKHNENNKFFGYDDYKFGTDINYVDDVDKYNSKFERNISSDESDDVSKNNTSSWENDDLSTSSDKLDSVLINDHNYIKPTDGKIYYDVKGNSDGNKKRAFYVTDITNEDGSEKKNTANISEFPDDIHSITENVDIPNKVTDKNLNTPLTNTTNDNDISLDIANKKLHTDSNTKGQSEIKVVDDCYRMPTYIENKQKTLENTYQKQNALHRLYRKKKLHLQRSQNDIFMDAWMYALKSRTKYINSSVVTIRTRTLNGYKKKMLRKLITQIRRKSHKHDKYKLKIVHLNYKYRKGKVAVPNLSQYRLPKISFFSNEESLNGNLEIIFERCNLESIFNHHSNRAKPDIKINDNQRLNESHYPDIENFCELIHTCLDRVYAIQYRASCITLCILNNEKIHEMTEKPSRSHDLQATITCSDTPQISSYFDLYLDYKNEYYNVSDVQNCCTTEFHKLKSAINTINYNWQIINGLKKDIDKALDLYKIVELENNAFQEKIDPMLNETSSTAKKINMDIAMFTSVMREYMEKFDESLMYKENFLNKCYYRILEYILNIAGITIWIMFKLKKIFSKTSNYVLRVVPNIKATLAHIL